MKKRIIIVLVLMLTIISSVVYAVLSNDKKDNIKIDGNQIAMYLLDGENGNVLNKVNTIEANYLLDTTKTVCTGASGVTGTVTLENQKLNLHTNGPVKCKVYFYEKPICTTNTNIKFVDESGNVQNCVNKLNIGQRMKIGDQYFRYIRTTNTSDTTHTYNECQDGGDASIACTDADSRHPLADNQLRLLAEYNLYVGAIYNGSSKISDVDTTSTTYGLQDSTAIGWVSSGNKVATIAYGSSNNNYSQSNVKTYTDNYASYLNTTYFSGLNKVSGSAITIEELVMLGCNRSGGANACNGAPNWVYTTSYWSGSPRINAKYVWYVFSNANLFSDKYSYANSCGVRPVISISASSI